MNAREWYLYGEDYLYSACFEGHEVIWVDVYTCRGSEKLSSPPDLRCISQKNGRAGWQKGVLLPILVVPTIGEEELFTPRSKLLSLPPELNDMISPIGFDLGNLMLPAWKLHWSGDLLKIRIASQPNQAPSVDVISQFLIQTAAKNEIEGVRDLIRPRPTLHFGMETPILPTLLYRNSRKDHSWKVGSWTQQQATP
ncbi:uncharacterized protein C8R40DRAFT_1070332 [Lentinula edodes]|uniref:uncharacterized protein n=1 Tax=Lentinula edodes TaxID=5353 RepID=UPI001E8D8B1E|nr:uncharacterized protein C8R40DRAFT_1070332 [Lentinula edodes]KAH7874180.1 hypothetical protein C8R40DRAFT_1070332 [Lentinula edodes]